jgi:predicted nucleic acid-binding protein
VSEEVFPARERRLRRRRAAEYRVARSDARIGTALEHAGRSIGPLDRRIAAHALALHLIPITNDLDEFSRVPGARLRGLEPLTARAAVASQPGSLSWFRRETP